MVVNLMMKCMENMCELDYYSEIVDYYSEITEYNDFSFDTIENYSFHSYIRLMNEVKNEKNLQDACIADVAKNSIILILNLFDKKCQISSAVPLENLSETEKKKIRNALVKFLDDFS